MSPLFKLMVVGLAVLLIAGAATALGVLSSDEDDSAPADGGSSAALRLGHTDRTLEDTNDPIERGCMLDDTLLRRIYNGYDPLHSEDVTTVPLKPNYSGAFSVTSHSGPWDYLQRVPLVFYGPGYIKASGKPLMQEASIVDVYPTVGELSGVELEPRSGALRSEILEPDPPKPPKLVVTIIWDAVGRNVLERWPHAWPNLARLEQQGSSFYNSFVGSSPSITPATHASLGTGAYPREHGVTAIVYRDKSGVRGIFMNRDPGDLKLTTYGDQIDQAFDDESKVGLLGWRSWHLGLMGHGAAIEGGDADELGIIGLDEHITGNQDFYSTPSYLKSFPGLEERIEELDREDGEVDGDWLGHPIATKHDNPAWVNYEADVFLAMLQRGAYGADDVPDLFFSNFKMTDIAGHQYSMDSREERAVLQAQDAALGRIVDYLEQQVGDFVLVLSADHGNSPSPQRSGSWPILQGQLSVDVDVHFGIDDGGLINSGSAVGPFLNRDVARRNGVTAQQVAEFLNGYTIRDNWAGDELPAGYEERGNENVFAAAWASEDLPEVLDCAGIEASF